MMFRLVRKLDTGKVIARPRGRCPAGAVNGYEDESGAFKEGNPPKKRGRRGKRGRPKGSSNKVVTKSGGGLSEIEAIVRREVNTRLKTARAAAIAAFNKALE
jgi:hypothetical protein